MKNKSVTLAVAAAVICIAAVLGIKMAGSNSPAIEPADATGYSESSTFASTYPLFRETELFTPESTTAESTTENQSETQPQSTTIESSPTTTLTEKVTQIANAVNTAFKEVFTLPKAPKYVEPETDIDFNTAKLASYKFNPSGNYYYTDDKDCWQSNFGFNEVYDNFAPITMMYYDTVRTTFEYGGKEWLIQIWKGQYGMAFVGGEVGVYTRRLGSGGTHFVCADKEDWLNMEMAFMWDEYSNGNYRAVFNRDYDKYWWATGFVVGFPNGSLRQTLKEFRLVTHITFKDTEMANAFCEAFEANGFTKVAKLDNNTPDTFVQVGPDVGFVWQNINHK